MNTSGARSPPPPRAAYSRAAPSAAPRILNRRNNADSWNIECLNVRQVCSSTATLAGARELQMRWRLLEAGNCRRHAAPEPVRGSCPAKSAKPTGYMNPWLCGAILVRQRRQYSRRFMDVCERLFPEGLEKEQFKQRHRVRIRFDQNSQPREDAAADDRTRGAWHPLRSQFRSHCRCPLFIRKLHASQPPQHH